MSDCEKCIHYCVCVVNSYCHEPCGYYEEQRSHGEWTPKQIILGGNGAVFMHEGYECSCGRVVTQKENYCPDCGARMISSNSEIENPCKTCTKYIGNMCEHVCEKRYEYVMMGGDEK